MTTRLETAAKLVDERLRSAFDEEHGVSDEDEVKAAIIGTDLVYDDLVLFAHNAAHRFLRRRLEQLESGDAGPICQCLTADLAIAVAVGVHSTRCEP